MEIWQAIFLGIVQGITEWLPVSSSGHLVIFQKLFGLNELVAFDIWLHFATLLVVLIIYFEDIKKIILAWAKLEYKSDDFKLGLFIVLGSIPIAVIGFMFKDWFKSLFSSLFAVAIALIFTGIVLLLTKIITRQKNKLNLPTAILVGIAQAIAIIPGVSRSGMTISSALFLGIDRKDCAKFSFLLSIPAIMGAVIFEGKDLFIDNFGQNSGVSFLEIIFGVLTAFIVGYFCLKWLIRVVEKGDFYKFGYYCLCLGIIILLINFIF